MSVRSILIKMFSRTHTAEETAGMIVQMLGLDTPKDDHGHWFDEEGAPCPHDNGMAGLSEDQRKQAVKIVKALSGKNPKINRKSQDKHINAAAAKKATERERNANPGRKITPKSYFTVKLQSVDAMVRYRIAKGDYTVKPGRYGTIHLLVNVERPVGLWYNRKEEKQRTNMVCVDFSESEGYHMYPVKG